jgi:hypothetical protein
MSARSLSVLAALEALSLVVRADDGAELGRIVLTNGPEGLRLGADAALIASATRLGATPESLREYIAATVSGAAVELGRAARGLGAHPSRGAPN